MAKIPLVPIVTVVIVAASGLAAFLNYSSRLGSGTGGETRKNLPFSSSKTEKLAELITECDGYLRSQEWAKAVEVMNKAIDIDASDTLLVKRGEIFIDWQKQERAIPDFSLALKLNAQNDKALLNRAACYYATRSYQLAMADYQTILALKKSTYSKEAILGQALCHYSLGQYGLAIHQCRELLNSSPKYLKAIEVLANCQLRQGSYLDAVDTYTSGLRIDHDAAGLYFGRSSAYFKNKMPERALADLQKATQCSPSNIEYHLKCATVAKSLGKNDLVRSEAESVLKLSKDNKEAEALLHALSVVN
ncbi:MAG: tetratricopeptide repeat protein [Candidatus Melainabacteria bacterium]|nr:tetratricopeptide repeat protein [Candidatus Melainabacteria bacterium]